MIGDMVPGGISEVAQPATLRAATIIKPAMVLDMAVTVESDPFRLPYDLGPMGGLAVRHPPDAD